MTVHEGGAVIWLAAAATDLRKGIDGLSAPVELPPCIAVYSSRSAKTASEHRLQ